MFGIWILRGAVVILVLGAGVGARLTYEKVVAPAPAPDIAAAQAQESSDLYDCSDFDTQEEAQAVYDQDTSDPYGLDEDDPQPDDGIACEALPSSTDDGGGNTSTSGDQYDNDDGDTRPVDRSDRGNRSDRDDLFESGGTFAAPVAPSPTGCPPHHPIEGRGYCHVR